MERTKKILLYLLAGILGGCVPVMSFHPLYTENDLVFDEKLLGSWVDDSNKNMLEFSKSEKSEKTYQVIYVVTEGDGKGKGIFDAHLVKLEGKLFLDVFPNQLPCGELEDPNQTKWFYNAFFTIPVHTFAKVDSIEPQLKLRLSDNETMEKFLEKDPNAVGHEMLEESAVLTARTKELQKFAVKYADGKEFFSKELVLKRVTGKKSEEAAKKIAEPNKTSQKKSVK